ncbi:hypothetical protein ACIBSW_32990 [Actinoplanes sp. NPDC049668]
MLLSADVNPPSATSTRITDAA